MNVFYLDKNPLDAAQYHCDKHVVKMIIEYAQLMSTAHRILDGELYNDKTANGRNIKRWRLKDEREGHLYKASHINHPSAVWCRASAENYFWLFELFMNLCEQYTIRYGKVHKTQELMNQLIEVPKNIAHSGFTEPPPAMPDYCKIKNNSVASYRKYYIEEKKRFATWKTSTPKWFLKEEYASL
jgi:hypothetical protein